MILFKQWNPNLKGVHIIQHFGEYHFDVSQLDVIGEQLDALIKGLGKFSSQGGLINPIVAIINLVRNPGTNYSHEIERTGRHTFNRTIAIKNALRKYPFTESIVLEGGANIVLYSSKPFQKS